jgi:hypothetical protein
MGSILLFGTLAVSVCACKQPSGSEPPAASSGAAGPAAPAVWEPIDKDFKGCEGG